MASLNIYKKHKDIYNYISEDNLIAGAPYIVGNCYFINANGRKILREKLKNSMAREHDPKFICSGWGLCGTFRSLSTLIDYRFADGYLTTVVKKVNGSCIIIDYFYRDRDCIGCNEYYYKNNYELHSEIGPARISYDQDNKITECFYFLNGKLFSEQEWQDQIATKLYW